MENMEKMIFYTLLILKNNQSIKIMTQQQQNLDRFKIGILDKSLNIIIKPDTKFDVIKSEDKNGKTQYHLVIYEGFSIDENGNYIKDKDGNRIKKELLRKLIDPKYEAAYSNSGWFSSNMEFCFGDFYWIEKYPENFTLLQSTGLKDKNGRLVYEGDILKYAVQVPDNYYILKYGVQVPDDCYIVYFKIEYNTNKCCFYAISLEDKKYDFMFSNDATQDMEIIGNIHTHPELLTSIEKGEEIHL